MVMRTPGNIALKKQVCYLMSVLIYVLMSVLIYVLMSVLIYSLMSVLMYVLMSVFSYVFVYVGPITNDQKVSAKGRAVMWH